MRFGSTHDSLTKRRYPHLKRKKIREINHDIDNPSKAYTKMMKSLGLGNQNNFGRLPNMNYVGHRNMGGHKIEDLPYLVAKHGPEAIDVWGDHMAWDILKDTITKTHGRFIGNLFEDILIELNSRK